MRKGNGLKILSFFAAMLCFGISHALGADLYVDASAAAGGDGTSWAYAYTDLQEALTAAAGEDTIHVAQGTYIPGDTRDASFFLDRSLTLLGGIPLGDQGTAIRSQT